jgi:prophage maintenance system killer protein
MRDLTVDEVVAVHRTIMVAEQGDTRVISEASLLQLVFSANLIPGVIQRAGFIFYSLCAFPPFREGNVPTAVALTEKILSEAGYCITGSRADLAVLARGIRDYTAEPEDTDLWFERNTRCSRE